MSDALIRAAFESRVAAWAAAQSPAIPVSYQNVAFTPPAGRYLRAWVLPAPTQSQTLNGEHRARRGVFQVDLNLPIGTGPAAANALCASLDAAFPLSAPMTQGGTKVFLLSPMSQGPSLESPTHYTVPVSCEYRCDTIV